MPAGTIPKAAADPVCREPGAARDYELARAAALAGKGGAGTAVIRARGIAGWLAVRASLPALPAGPPSPRPQAPAAAPAAAVLADMTLAALAAR